MTLLVLSCVSLGVLAHLLDLFLGKAASSSDRNLLLLLRAEILGRDVENAVGVNIEGDFNLRNATRSRRNAIEVEVSEALVVASHLAVALEDSDRHGRLIVSRSREDLRLLGGNRSIALDKRSQDTAERFYAERKRRHVEKENVLNFALQDAALNCRAHSNDFIGVDAFMRLLVEEALCLLLNKRHSRLTANENNFIHRRKISIAHALAARLGRAIDEIHRESLELGLVERSRKVERPRLVHRDERKIDVIRCGRRKSALGLFSLFLKTLKSHHVLREVNTLRGLEVFNEPLHDGLVEVVTAEVRIAVRGLHLKDAVTDIKNGDIERTATEVVDGDLLVLLLVKTVSERSCCRLIDDALNLKTCNLTGILSGLALLVVEVSGNGDDSLGDLLAQERLCVLLELAKNHRRNLLRRVDLIAHLDCRIAISGTNNLIRHHLDLIGHLVIATADEALDGVNRGFGVRNSLTLSGLANENFTRLGKCND